MTILKAGLDHLADDIVNGIPRSEFIRLFYPASADTAEKRAHLDDKVDADLEENGYGMEDCLDEGEL